MGRCLREKETERQKDGKTRGGTGHGFDPILLQLRKHLSEANFFSMGKRNSTGQGYRLQRKKKKKNIKANLYYFLGL